MATLSVLLICLNEEANIPNWLDSVKPFADQIVAVDSGSTDGTVKLLKSAGALVEHRDWSGYSDQRNHAASLCTGDWVVILDADEWADAELCASLNQLKTRPGPKENAFEISAKVFFFGKFLRHGGFFPERHLRVYRNGTARWPKREVHETLETQGPVGRLPGYFHHHSYRSVLDYLRRMDRYASEAAKEMFKRGKTASGPQAWSHAAWAFFSRYILRAGWLDGFEGYLAARCESMYTLTKYARLRELVRLHKEKP